MTTFTFRPQTLDFDIFNMVYFNNEYRLPDRFHTDDIIIDIGAHIGSFAYAVLVRGAKHVLSVEAHPQNYGLACTHLHGAITMGLLDLRWGAVWRSDHHRDTVACGGFSMIGSDIINTGNVEVQAGNTGQLIPRYALDDLIQAYHPQRIRLLKLDCEGSEFPILLTSTQLHQVDEIVGEFHEFGGAYDKRQPNSHLSDYTRYTIDVLLEYLHYHGFNTTDERHQHYQNGDWLPQRTGYFRATRHR